MASGQMSMVEVSRQLVVQYERVRHIGVQWSSSNDTSADGVFTDGQPGTTRHVVTARR